MSIIFSIGHAFTVWAYAKKLSKRYESPNTRLENYQRQSLYLRKSMRSSRLFWFSVPSGLCGFLHLGVLVSGRLYSRRLNTFGGRLDPGGCSCLVLEIYLIQKRVTGRPLTIFFPGISTRTHRIVPNSVAQLVIDGLAARFDLKLRYESRALAYHAETQTSVPTQLARPNLKLTFAKTSVLCFFFRPVLSTHPIHRCRALYERVRTCSEKDVRRKASQHSNLSSAQPPYDHFARFRRPKTVHCFPAVWGFSSWTQRCTICHKRTGNFRFLSNTAGDRVPT